jgi:hypothetical protein
MSDSSPQAIDDTLFQKVYRPISGCNRRRSVREVIDSIERYAKYLFQDSRVPFQ